MLSNETIGIIVDFIGKSRDLLHEFADINKKTIFYLNREVVMSSQSYREPALKDRLLANLLLVLVLSWIVVSAFFMFEIIDPLFWLLIVFTSIILITLWQSVTRGFRCTNCGFEFKITFWQHLATINSIPFGKKMLKCPECKFKDYGTELIRKKDI